MTVEKTAYKHFLEDISRAVELSGLAKRLPSGRPATKLIHDDVLRSSWMYAIGSLDAYFCDKYGDLLAATMIAKSREKKGKLPVVVANIGIPASTFFSPVQDRENWRYRMAARKIIEKDNVLSLEKVQTIFNPFLRDGHKLFDGVIDFWMSDPDATAICFGVKRSVFLQSTKSQRVKLRKAGKKNLMKRFRGLYQRRHDCIHNCDRPKISVIPITEGQVRNVIKDVKFVVTHFEDHINSEYPLFLRLHNFGNPTINHVGY
jgi:hypothetical protein